MLRVIQRSGALCSAVSTRSFWNHVPMGPPDPIIGVTEAFNRDTNPNKMNVGVGAYRDDSGKPFVLPSVRAAEEKLLTLNLNHEYLPTHGCPNLRAAAKVLAFGKGSDVVKENLVASAQSISGVLGNSQSSVTREIYLLL